VPQIIESESIAINLERRSSIPTGEVFFLGRDLRARSRLEAIPGVAAVVPVGSPEALPDLQPDDVLVVDLDEGGGALVEQLSRLRPGPTARVVGFFSHVDTELGKAATAAGISAYPRGRFWADPATILFED
jgi:hypothetical protein